MSIPIPLTVDRWWVVDLVDGQRIQLQADYVEPVWGALVAWGYLPSGRPIRLRGWSSGEWVDFELWPTDGQ